MPPCPSTAPQLFPFDQFHGRELIATREHGARLAPASGAHILDIGCGIGGPARYLVHTFGCTVTGIDLTPSFVEVVTELTALCGMQDQVTYARADATALPFADDTFDAAVCFYVGMNLPDKPAVLAETARVLKPGGRLIWSEVVLTGGTPLFPLPWATSPEGIFLSRQADLTDGMAAAGLTVQAALNEAAATLELARQMQQSGKQMPASQHQANEVVLGAGFMERRRNYIRSLADGQFTSVLIEAAKT